MTDFNIIDLIIGTGKQAQRGGINHRSLYRHFVRWYGV